MINLIKLLKLHIKIKHYKLMIKHIYLNIYVIMMNLIIYQYIHNNFMIMIKELDIYYPLKNKNKNNKNKQYLKYKIQIIINQNQSINGQQLKDYKYSMNSNNK